MFSKFLKRKKLAKSSFNSNLPLEAHLLYLCKYGILTKEQIEERMNEIAGLVMPQIYCIGAPKTATSYYYSILRDHGSLNFPDKDYPILGRLRTELKSQSKDIVSCLIDYCAQFRDGGLYNAPFDLSKRIAIFEVGISRYDLTPGQIKVMFPRNAQFLFCMRDPVERALSEYKMRVRQFIDRDNGKSVFVENLCFLEALAQSEKRKSGNPKYYQSYQSYIEGSLYAWCLSKFIGIFSRDQFLIISIQKNHTTNSNSILKEIFRFFSIYNESATYICQKNHDNYSISSSSPSNIDISVILTSPN